MKALARRISLVSALAALSLLASSALAYNEQTHLRLTDLAWQVMRAAADPDLMDHIQWDSANLPGAIPLDTPGSCATGPRFCGRTVSDDEWRRYLEEIRLALPRLNRLDPDVPNDGCFPATAPSLSAFAADIDSRHKAAFECNVPVPSDEVIPGQCNVRTGDNRYRWDGIYSAFTPGSEGPDVTGATIPDDGARRQGIVLGWHGKSRDDDLCESRLQWTPFFGHALDLYDSYVDLQLTAIFAPFVCLYFLFSGDDDCLDAAKRLADRVNPADFLRSLLPGIGRDRDGDLVGLWHFINVQEGAKDWFDNHPGLHYPEAGPRRGGLFGESADPGVIDQAIMIASDLLSINLRYSKSAGAVRYQVTADDGHPKTDPIRRGHGTQGWQSEKVGHTVFSPIDNLAFYGWDQYERSSRRRAEWLGWPLHALGDAAEPHHVLATTSWGHRPFEDWVDNNLLSLVYLQCGKPNEPPCGDSFQANQLAQAKRVLQWGFRWHEFLQSHGIRDLVTAVAEQTLAHVQDFGGDEITLSYPLCDACSFFYQMQKSGNDLLGIIEKAGVSLAFAGEIPDGQVLRSIGEDPIGYYDGLGNDVQELLEMSAGSMLAFLVHASSGICRDLGDSCSENVECCSQSCQNGSCCRDRGACGGDGECCNGVCGPDPSSPHGRCCTDFGDTCSDSDECCDGSCQNGSCCLPLDSTCSESRECCPSAPQCAEASDGVMRCRPILR